MLALEAAPVSPDWYISHTLTDGVTHIFERHITSFFRCNIWHVKGRKHDLLIDSGTGVVSLTGSLPWLLKKDILAVASHCHFDHIGNHHEFAARACHCSEASTLAQPTATTTLADRFALIEMFDTLPPGGYQQERYAVRPAPATRLLEDGDVIDLGDRQFEILHIPGHSPGSIALWEADRGILFSGDALYDGPLVDDAYHSIREDYCESMAKLRALPVQIVHGGHYPSFGRDRFHILIDNYLAGR